MESRIININKFAVDGNILTYTENISDNCKINISIDNTTNNIIFMYNNLDGGINKFGHHDTDIIISYIHKTGCQNSQDIKNEYKPIIKTSDIVNFIIEIYHDPGPQSLQPITLFVDNLKKNKASIDNIDISYTRQGLCFKQKKCITFFYNSIYPGVKSNYNDKDTLYIEFVKRYVAPGTIVTMSAKMNRIEISKKIKNIIINFSYDNK